MMLKWLVASNRRLGRYLPLCLILGDWLVLNLSVLFSLWIFPHVNIEEIWKVFVIINISFLPPAVSRFRIHNQRTLGYEKIMSGALFDVLVTLIISLALLYLFNIYITKEFIIVFFVVFCFILTLWSLISQKIIRNARRKGYNYKKALLVGSGRTARHLIQHITGYRGYGIKITRVFDDNPTTHNSISDIYTGSIESTDKVRSVAIKEEVNIIYFTLDGNDVESLIKMMQIAEEVGAEFIYIPKLPNVISSQFEHKDMGSMHAMVHKFSPLDLFRNRIVKRMFDLMVSIPFAIVSPLIFIPIAIGIKMSSPGPIFFKQKRTGLHGKDFVCLKFRTMRVNEKSDFQQATKNDPRKTKFGDFLRRTSLDELPQFYNVLWGSMTVVGPRPHMVSQTEEYGRQIDKYMIRHAVKPGITGWAQVNGYRGATEELWQMEKRVEHDVWYISNWSVFLDIKIMFMTVFNQLKGEENAY